MLNMINKSLLLCEIPVVAYRDHSDDVCKMYHKGHELVLRSLSVHHQLYSGLLLDLIVRFGCLTQLSWELRCNKERGDLLGWVDNYSFHGRDTDI